MYCFNICSDGCARKRDYLATFSIPTQFFVRQPPNDWGREMFSEVLKYCDSGPQLTVTSINKICHFDTSAVEIDLVFKG